MSPLEQYTDWLALLSACGEQRVELGLDRMRMACARCGHPERMLRTVHIAGTNGKGSTGAFLTALARGAGLQVGHYTSPHLCEFTERIAVNGQPISHAACTASARVCVPLVADLALTYFEYATLIGFHAMAHERPALDLVVIEVGLGGRLDATNVLDDPACVVLTPIARDHEAYLGNTLTAIAHEKCGIIKPGVPVVSAPQSDEAAAVIVATCAERGAPLHWALPLAETIALGLPGAHQRVNAGTAWHVARILMQQGVAPMSPDALAQARWPGRCEWLRQDPPLLFDGAHNPQGAAALAEYVREARGPRAVTAIVAGMADKDWDGMIAALVPVIDRWICVPLDHPRALLTTELDARLKAAGRVSAVATIESSLANQAADVFAVVCGSLYLYAPIVAVLKRRN